MTSVGKRVEAVFREAQKLKLAKNLTEFHGMLMKLGFDFANSTLNKVRNGYPAAQNTLTKIEDSLKAFCDRNNIDIDDVTVNLPSISEAAEESTSKGMSGVWLLVQFRGKRSRRNQRIAHDDYRTALLIYDRGHGSAQKFRIFGPSTRWEGEVTSNDEKLIYQAKEISDAFSDEHVWMLMIKPSGRTEINYHHGLILGVARSEEDLPAYPIYACRVMLRQIPAALVDPKLLDTIGQEPDDIRKSLCGYFPRKPARSGSNPFQNFLHDSFDLFDELATHLGNFGDRIFVQS